MSSASDVSTAACTLPSSNASSTNRISDAYSNSTPVLSSNAPMSTSQVSDYSNFSHVPPPPPKISSFKQRFSTYNNAYYSNETSGVQARFHPSSSLSNFTCWDLYSMYSGQSLDNKFSSSNTLSLHKSVDGKPPLTTYEEIDKRTCKSSYPSSKGSSVYSSQRETPPVEKAHSPLPSIPVESLAARIMALAKGNSSPLDIKNKPLNEVSNISPLPSSSFNTSSVTSGHMLSIDNWSKRNSPAISSVITPTHTKDINGV
ncbi:hypothetical protein Avbf_02561 [Armadillidium vulgare]|nr:hypothetical protein Avbf_02561 [Armadillidium vulgare]